MPADMPPRAGGRHCVAPSAERHGTDPASPRCAHGSDAKSTVPADQPVPAPVRRHREYSEERIRKEIDEQFALYATLKPGWDGHNAEPVNPRSLADARKFLGMRPTGVRLPHPQIDPEGVVGLFWRTGDGAAYIDFEGDGLLSYYARQGARDDPLCREILADGRPFEDGWPRELLAFLPRK